MRRLLTLLAVLALLVAACGSDGGSDGTAGPISEVPTGDGPALAGEITVSAAASLTESFTEIGAQFEDEHPGTTITFTFDSSGTLSQQILEGAPVDVFASADEANLAKVADEDLVAGDGQVFARNQLAIVTKPGNPEGITSLADLVGVGTVALCGEDVPCGRFAAEALAAADVAIDEGSVTRGQNAKATLSAVTEGDAVAGIVYVTDVLAAGDAAELVDIPEADNVIAIYPVAVLAESSNTALAEAFVAYVLGDEAQLVLKEYGFLTPS